LFPKNIYEARSSRQRILKVRKLPDSLRPLWLAVLGNVLIVAREEVVAALLGLMVELRGLRPTFLGRAESVESAIAREAFEAVVIDCDYPECERLMDAIRNTGVLPILFSPFRMQAEVKEVAARHGIRSFTLPTDADTFGRMLDA